MVFRVFIAMALFCGLWIGCADQTRDFDLTLVVGGEPESLDPAQIQSLSASRIADSLFEGLTNLNIADPTHPLPGLAESWTSSDDGRTYTFHLRAARWSNNAPVTAHDFVYSWKRLLTRSNGFQYADFLFYLKNGRRYYDGEVPFDQVGVRAAGDRTLVVTLERPTAHFLQLTAFTTFRPVYPPSVEQRNGGWTRPEHFVTSGPFVLEEWRFKHRIVLRKNPRYWDAANVRLESVALLAVKSENTALNLYESGAVDFISSVPGPILDTLKVRDDFQGGVAFGTYFIRFNTQRKPFDDPRIRQAFALAIDRQTLVRHVTRGHTQAARGFVPPGSPGYDAIEGLRFDPDDARRLLAEAGYPDGKGFPKVAYLFNKNENNTEIAQVLKAAWKDVLNIDVGMDDPDWKVYVGRLTGLQYDLSRGNWYGDYLAPSTFLDMFTTGNHFNQTGWSDADYDRLVDTANQTLAAAPRRALYREAEQILVEQQTPIAPLFHTATTNMIKPWVKGMTPNLRNVIRVKDFWVDTEAKNRSETAQ